ncbi:hypothetical protein NL676_024634 [Syzygium grande]|nr:hypothetical protein NL676_024634 [Syzygium grande]
MASFFASKTALPKLFLALCLLQMACATRRLAELVQDQSPPMLYHNGPLLSGKISVNLIWYGRFKASQRTIISDFVNSLSSDPSLAQAPPSVSQWWKTVDKYYKLSSSKRRTPSLTLSLGRQRNAVNVVLTSSDVAVEGFCMSRCGSHGSAVGSVKVNGRSSRFAYIWVGNSETQCPGQCAWPYHQPLYGPQSPPLVAPNGDVGVDGMVINLAGLLAGTATNPFSNGYYQGEAGASLEAASACTGIYANGAYPGFAGNLLVDEATGGELQRARRRREKVPGAGSLRSVHVVLYDVGVRDRLKR